MQENKHHIDEFLQKAMAQASADAPGIDWNGFENYRNRKKKKRIIYISLATIIPILILFIGWCNLGYKHSISADSLASESHKKRETQNPNDIHMPDKSSSEFQISAPKSYSHAASTNKKNTTSKQAFKQIETIATHTAGENALTDSANQMNPQIQSPGGAIEENHENPEPQISFVKWQGLKLLTIALPAWLQNAAAEREPRDLKPTPPDKNCSFVQIQIGPNFNNPNFKTTPLGAAFIHKNYTRILNQFETGRAGTSWQLSGGIQKNRWSGMAGIGMSQLKNTADFDYEYSEVPIIDINSKIIGYNQSAPTRMQFNANQHYTFLEIPLYAQYTLIQKPKTSYSLRTGMVNQLLYQLGGVMPNSVYLDRQEQMQNGNYKSYTFSWELGLPLEYKTSSNMSLSLTPYYRHNAGFKQLQSLYTSQFNNWGLYFNLKYYMNK